MIIPTSAAHLEDAYARVQELAGGAMRSAATAPPAARAMVKQMQLSTICSRARPDARKGAQRSQHLHEPCSKRPDPFALPVSGAFSCSCVALCPAAMQPIGTRGLSLRCTRGLRALGCHRSNQSQRIAQSSQRGFARRARDGRIGGHFLSPILAAADGQSLSTQTPSLDGHDTVALRCGRGEVRAGLSPLQRAHVLARHNDSLQRCMHALAGA